MWNNLFRLTLLSYLWTRHKRTVIGLPLLLLYFWVVGLIHQDYLHYTTLNSTGSEAWIGLSFLVKWGLMLLGALVFVLLHLRKSKSNERRTRVENENNASGTAESFDAAFDSIRVKKKLRSKADCVIDKARGGSE